MRFSLGIVFSTCFVLLHGEVFGQAEPLRVGFLTVRTGPLAAGGRQMEEGINLFLKERNNTLAGRKVEIIFADTAGQPAQARTKAQELVNTTVATYPNVGQFWTYDPKAFITGPQYSRDYPPTRFAD